MVKCSECGFLAVRNMETRNLEEIEFESRQSGIIKTQRYVYIPVCFVVIANFAEEINNLKQLPKYEEKKDAIGGVLWPHYSDFIIETLKKERECKSFTKWHQGSTPKEHQEMIDRESMLKWQAEREEADKKWREQQEQKHSKEEWNRNIFLAAITIIAVILGVILGNFMK